MMAHLVPRIEYPELVIGLVAPIGTPLTETISQLRQRFESANYDVVEIKVTDIYRFLEPHIKPEKSLDDSDQIRRYRSYIAYGNQIRSALNDGSVLAALTIQRIVASRLKAAKSDKEKFTRTVYILSQFKRPEEIDLLRAVYGKIFFQMSVYSRRAARVEYLARRFAEDAGQINHDQFRAEAESLVNDDQDQQKEKFGQRIAKIFHEADFVVNRDISKPSVDDQVGRFFE